MKRIGLLMLFGIMTASLLSSCTKDSASGGGTTNVIVLPEGGSSVIRASNQFAFDFFHATMMNDQEFNNKLISPLSIYLALSMVYNGADHATKDSMANALKLTGIDIQSLNQTCRALLSQLPGEDSRVQLDIANSIWYRQSSFQPVPAFLDVVQSDYFASVKSLNFDDPASVGVINKWVSDKTKNKIRNIIDDISPDELMFIVNAIYFNGKWQQEFKASLTKNDDFHLQDGSDKSVPFMNQRMKLMMSKNASFTIAELPYGGEKGFSMYVLKPADSKVTLNTFANSLDEKKLDNAIAGMDSSLVDLSVPKWEYAYEISDMKPELSMLGMGIAFQKEADFSKMYDVDVRITKAIHKTYIKVDEKGTEAAAVTGIGMGTTSSPIVEKLKLDHPFLYLIIEKQTGGILFLGTLNDPVPNS